MIKKRTIFYTCAFLLSFNNMIGILSKDQEGNLLQKRQRRSIFDTVSDESNSNETGDNSNNPVDPIPADPISEAEKEDARLLEQTGDPTTQFASETGSSINRFIEDSLADPVEDTQQKTPSKNESDTKGKPLDQTEEKKPEIETAYIQEGEQEEPKEIVDSIGSYPGQKVKSKKTIFDTLHDSKEIPESNSKEEQEEAEPEIKVNLEEEKPEKTQDELIEFYFEDADIQNLLNQIEDIYNINFITDGTIDPLGPDGKALKGNKISFKTNKPLNKKTAWNLFLTFLDLAGFALVPEADPGYYRVVSSEKAQKSPVPAYIGVEPESLPDNDQVVRFVYFIENAEINTIKDIVNTLKSPNARAVILQEVKALVITDKAYNIKSLMQIIQELDQVSMPQSMSVLKLQRADVTDVKKLYDTISKTGRPEQQQTRLFGARKQSPSIYFPENARLIAEPRSNSLILLGPEDAIKKIENFIMKYVDVELEKPYSPLHTYQLRYASATTVSDIMNNMAQFGRETPAGQSGGVRGGDKYLKPMSFTPEPATNTVVIKGDYEDYLKALEIIKKLDEPQPQVAVEALILTLNFEDNKEVGSQIRNKIPGPNGLLGNNVDFQTSGIRLGGLAKGIQTNNTGPGADRLLANLINLVSGAGAGNTIFSLGADAFGVWGIFNILQSITNTQVVSNPFLVATNKTKASVSIGEIRRVTTSTIFAGEEPADAFGDFSAELKLEVTPQINSDGMIILKLNVLFENFIGSLTDPEEAAKQTRTVDTKTIVADREVIAIGGLIQNRIAETLTKVPVLGDIPVLGWLFRNKSKDVVKDNLLILISTRIIEPEVTEIVDIHTQQKLEDYYETVETFQDIGEYRDPVYRRFFDDQQENPAKVVEDFLFKRREKDITQDEDDVIDEKVTQGGKFYRPGKTKTHAVIKQPEKKPEPPAIPENQSLYKSGLLKQLSDQPDDTIRLTKNSPYKSRRRDARRSLQQHIPDDQIGVLT